MSADEVMVDIVFNRDVLKGEVISFDLPNLSLSSSSLVSSVQRQSISTPLMPEVIDKSELKRLQEELERKRILMEDEMRKSKEELEKKHSLMEDEMRKSRELKEELERKHKLMEEELRKSRDAWQKMEEEREQLMKEAEKERERSRKEAEYEVEHMKKELQDKLEQISRRLEDKTDDVLSLPSPSQHSYPQSHSHLMFISPPSPNTLLMDR